VQSAEGASVSVPHSGIILYILSKRALKHSTAALEGVREQHRRGQQRAEWVNGGKIQIILSKNSYF
jgi:hypothetical protein